jgi:hypothetical protein
MCSVCTHTCVRREGEREKVHVSATSSSLCSYCVQGANEMREKERERERMCACMFVLSFACAGPKGWKNRAATADVVAVTFVAVIIVAEKHVQIFKFWAAKNELR